MERKSRKDKSRLAALTCILALTFLIPCSALTADPVKPLTKVRWAYVAATCEAAVFAAKEKGFWEAEGLDVELIKGDWNFIKESFAFNKIDGAQGMALTWLKAAEQGIDLKVVAGVHTGCIHVIAGNNTAINSVDGLKGKRIGVPAIGSTPFMFLNRVLGAKGWDVQKDVEWRAFPASELALVLEKGEVDAVVVSDPHGTMILADGKGRSILNTAVTPPYKDEYCCLIFLTGKFYRESPEAAAAVSRGLLKAAKWVSANPEAAASLAVGKKYVGGTVELNAKSLAGLNFIPSVSGGRKALILAGNEMKASRMLEAGTDIEQLAGRIFAPLSGVTDEWIDSIKVESASADRPLGMADETSGTPSALREAHR
ncbi:MAG: ABC transporter substrate-binding protein [Syntrophobacteraceae bacterium]|jgi:NitT/TauT family transport system substrate-binding protein